MTKLKTNKPFILILLLWWGLLPSLAANSIEKGPKVVVSITPFYGLVAAILQGINTPTLLVKPGASVHHHALKPSDIKNLENAALIIWGGPQLESYLIKPLKTLSTQSTPLILELAKIPTLHRFTSKSNGCEHHDHHLAHEVDPNHSTLDMHFWLDPQNAIAISQAIVYTLSNLDPLHASLYQKNGAALKKELVDLDTKITKQLKEVKNIPFIVFHDAYQYFTHRYQLKMVGIITLDPESSISAKRLNTILDIIQNTKAKCVFTEPNTRSTLIKNLVQDSSIKIGVLDPEGDNTMQNEKGYFTLLNNLTDHLKECLEAPVLKNSAQKPKSP